MTTAQNQHLSAFQSFCVIPPITTPAYIQSFHKQAKSSKFNYLFAFYVSSIAFSYLVVNKIRVNFKEKTNFLNFFPYFMLNDSKIKAAKPTGKPYKLTDSNRFYLKEMYNNLDLLSSILVKNALKMAILTAARPGEIRLMQWEQIDFKTALWAYTVTKTNTPHIVPLSTQALAILEEMKSYTGLNKYVFMSLRDSDKDRALSNTALLMALQRLGIKSTVHGFRASFRTIMDEVLNYPPHLLEQQLAHTVRDPLGRSYNRTAHLEQRKEMMQTWSNFLEDLENER